MHIVSNPRLRATLPHASDTWHSGPWVIRVHISVHDCNAAITCASFPAHTVDSVSNIIIIVDIEATTLPKMGH